MNANVDEFLSCALERDVPKIVSFRDSIDNRRISARAIKPLP